MSLQHWESQVAASLEQYVSKTPLAGAHTPWQKALSGKSAEGAAAALILLHKQRRAQAMPICC